MALVMYDESLPGPGRDFFTKRKPERSKTNVSV
jgi:hypothetical protein